MWTNKYLRHWNQAGCQQLRVQIPQERVSGLCFLLLPYFFCFIALQDFVSMALLCQPFWSICMSQMSTHITCDYLFCSVINYMTQTQIFLFIFSNIFAYLILHLCSGVSLQVFYGQHSTQKRMHLSGDLHVFLCFHPPVMFKPLKSFWEIVTHYILC